MFKTNCLRRYLKTTVRAYFFFCKIFDISEDERQNVHLFYDYIMLYCARDIQLYDEFIQNSDDIGETYDGGYSLEERQQIVHEWTRKKKPLTSKTMINDFYKRNAAHRIIIDSVPEL